MATKKRSTVSKTASPRKALPRKPKPIPIAPEPAPLDSEAPPPVWLAAIQAADSKKAQDLKVFDLRPVTTFADHMIICSGGNPRQIQTIADEIETRLKEAGERPSSVEGYTNAEWILMDYGDYVINIFSENARKYYDLERLWRDAPEVTLPVAQ